MGKRGGRKTNPRRAIREAFAELGMQARPHEIVRALAGLGVHVSEELVRAVQVEMLQNAGRVTGRLVRIPPKSPPPRRHMPRIFPRPGSRPHRGN